MRKTRVFGKVVNENPIALAIYTEQKRLEAEANSLEEELKENEIKLRSMNHKYATDRYIPENDQTPPYADPYIYVYPSDEIRMKELTEREEFYNTHCAPLEKRIDELWEKVWALREELCVALWGYGEKRYRLGVSLKEAEKELAEATARVNALREELAEME